ncbi:MAG: HIT family protein [Candidatus Yonathbacteria bacterium]|nr:HIT family protein [Candidatus Yonathbacteria bacterium]
MDQNCLFCKIIKGEVPAAKVYEDEHLYAFLDIKPINPGHTLLVPKKHFANIYETPDKILSALAGTAKKLSIAVKKAVKADGIIVSMNNDPAAGQVIFHSHIHIVPRYKNDGYEHWRGTPYRDGEIEEVEKRIKEMLG